MAGDYNLYRYVQNDPVNLQDPYGLAAAATTWGGVKIGGAAGTAIGGPPGGVVGGIIGGAIGLALGIGIVLIAGRNKEEKSQVDEKCPGAGSEGDDGEDPDKKKKVSTSEVGDRVRTPDTHKADFEKNRSGQYIT
jgi:uncharacterized protein RhaS with RHS repeats